MKEYLKALQKKVTVGIVGGSNVQKQQKQLGESGRCRGGGVAYCR